MMMMDNGKKRNYVGRLASTTIFKRVHKTNLCWLYPILSDTAKSFQVDFLKRLRNLT